MSGRVGLLAAVLLAVGWVPTPAVGDVFGRVDCRQRPDHPECWLAAGEPGGSDHLQAGPSGELTCHWGGEVVPCLTDEGWLGSDGCRYLLVDEPPPSWAREPGAAYRPRCPDDPPHSQRALVWLSDARAPGPAALGRVAVSRLVLPTPRVELSPPMPAPQLVGLPTWLWVAPQWWDARSAAVSVPGVTVTAVAEPVRVRWDTGDGRSLVCEGPGTPYRPSVDPAMPSPDCGHVYLRPSRSQPGHAFLLTATVTWRVSWSGGGRSGTADPLFSQTTVPVRVAESWSVNTEGRP